MTSQVLNLMWLNLELPPKPDPEDGTIRQPMPEKYIENVRNAGWKNSKAQVVLWVDSKRLTEKQMTYLKEAVELGRPNVRLKDLRSIPAYDNEKLYNEGETNPNWRNCGQSSLIWRQVDAAKILVSLQGNFDQTFYADLDYAHMNIKSQEVQDMLKTPGLFIGSGDENQLWGFTRNRRGFFEDYYRDALEVAYSGDNAWSLLLNKKSALRKKENIGAKMCLWINNDYTSAVHPGSEASDGHSATNKPAVVSSPGGLAEAFKKCHRSGKVVLLTAGKTPAFVPKLHKQLITAAL